MKKVRAIKVRVESVCGSITWQRNTSSLSGVLHELRRLLSCFSGHYFIWTKITFKLKGTHAVTRSGQ